MWVTDLVGSDQLWVVALDRWINGCCCYVFFFFFFFVCLVVLWWWFGGSGVRKFTLWWCLAWVCWVVFEFFS